MRAGREPEQEQPPPFGQIKFITGWAIIGKEIYMAGNLSKAVEARIKKANNTWRQVSRKIFRNNAFNRNVKILL